MRRVGLVGAFLFLTLVAGSVRAQVAAVSAKPLQGWIEDVREIGRISLPKELFEPLSGGLDQITGPNGLQGLDTKRSWGAFADMPKGQEAPFLAVVLPVTDGKALLESLKKLGLGVDEQAESKTFSHIVTLPNGVTKLFAHQFPGYLYLTPFPVRMEKLKALKPADLDALRPKTSELTVSVRLDRLPKDSVAAFQNGFEASMAKGDARQPGEEESRYIGRKLAQDLGRSGVVALLRDARELALDLSLDPKAGPIALELRLAAKPGSPTAKAFDRFGSGRSVFRGLGAGAVLDAFGVLPLSDEAKRALVRLTDLAKKDAAEKLKNSPATELKTATDLISVIEKVLTGDVVDMAMAIRGPYPTAGGSKFAVLLGLKLDDPSAVEKLIREAPNSQVAFDAAKSKDGKISIHRVDAKAAGNAEPDRMLGKMDVHFALAGGVGLVGVGEAGLQGVREALEQVAAPGLATKSQFELRFGFSKLMAFANTDLERKAGEEAAKEVFVGPDAAKDSFTLSIEAGDGTLRVRLGGDVILVKFLMQLGMRTQNAPMP